MAEPHSTPQGTSIHNPAPLRFVRIAGWWSITLERLWPKLMPLMLVAAAFAAISWFGVFRHLPDLGRMALGVAFAVAALAALWPLRGFKKPTPLEVDRRLERDNHLIHTPITIDQDAIAPDADAATQALWKAHKARIAARAADVGAISAKTIIPERDPWALRALAPLIAVTAFAFSFSPSGGTLTDVFSSHRVEAATPMRIDAWITPPSYTGIAPIFLTSDINAERTDYTVPEGSIAKIRLAGGTGQETARFNEADMVLTEDTQSAAATGARAFEVDMRAGGVLSIARGDEALGSWMIAVTDDTAPTIDFADEETRFQRAANGTWTLNYTMSDDYRVKSAQAVIELANPDLEGARPLYDAPELPLALPRRSSDDGSAKTVKDLTMHPWAGARIAITLEADDDLDQIGRSETVETVLPGRPFSNRLARALIEQRRNLALDANAARDVYDMLDVFVLYPEETIDNASHFLGITTAMSRLQDANTDDKLRDVVDYLWEIARQIEDGNLSEAERRMRQAQQALQDALENGASDEEISRLTDELREAMQEFMRELAEQARRNPQSAQQQQQNQSQQIEPQSLEEMLDQIEEMARSGSREQAMDMLQQLNDMMNNLQMAQPQQGQGQQGQSQAQQQMNELGEILRQQQELMNETFRQNREMRDGQQQQGQQGQQGQQQPGQQQGQNQPGQQPGQLGQGQAQQGQPGQQGQQGLQGLAPGQQALQQRLDEFMQSLADMGLQPGEAFDQAGESMQGAGEALGDEQGEAALAQQGEAMDALREGAGEMMQQMQQQAQNNGQGSTQPGGNRGANDRDPLGRPQRSSGPDFGESVDVPDEIDVRRAREILEAIRERLGNTLSPQLEKEYLERLLDLN